MNHQIFGSDSFVDYLAGFLLQGCFKFERGRVDVSAALSQLGDGPEGLYRQLEQDNVNAKAMKWIGGNPTAFRLSDGRAATTMVEQGFLVLLEKYGQFAVMDRVREALARQLAVPLGSVDVRLSLSDQGGGAGLHFDRWDTIQIHLFGRKTWWIGANVSVTAAIQSHVHGEPLHPELATYVAGDLDERPDLEKFELQPGDCFMVPIGTWHETEAHGPSCTAIVRVKIPAFVDLITNKGLRARLVQHTRWRERTYGLWNGPHLNSLGAAALQRLMRSSDVIESDVSQAWPEGL